MGRQCAHKDISRGKEVVLSCHYLYNFLTRYVIIQIQLFELWAASIPFHLADARCACSLHDSSWLWVISVRRRLRSDRSNPGEILERRNWGDKVGEGKFCHCGRLVA